MTPEERHLVQEVGIDLLQNFQLGVGPILIYGLFSPIGLITMWDLEKRRKTSWSAQATHFVIVFAFLAATGYLVTLVFIPFVKPRSVMIENIGMSLDDRATTGDNQVFLWENAELVLEQLPSITNDALIIWRAWAILARKNWALALLVTLWIASTVWQQPDGVVAAIQIIYYVFLLRGNSIYGPVSEAGGVLSILTNALATGFIAYILRDHLKTIQSFTDAKYRSSFKTWKILLLLFETGLAYCVFVNFDAMHQPTATQAMYPTLVTSLIQGPFSIVNIDRTVMSLRESSGILISSSESIVAEE
ncbi:hypothetical protein H0H92_005431 [Tricholoma furcatifolium]|nr:hypothetical protein H0H92_005431 [Tricholoma furcatifolium]